MMTGEEYKQSLNDGRRVFLEGDLVTDMASHPVFGIPVAKAARLYDRGYDATPGAVRDTMRIMKTPDDLRHHAHGGDEHDMLLGVTSASMMTLLTAADRIEDKLPQNATASASGSRRRKRATYASSSALPTPKATGPSARASRTTRTLMCTWWSGVPTGW